VFRDGKPARKDYRVFNVETVAEGRPDDFQAMKEALLKRYRRAVTDGKPLPDPMLIDGGKGQLSHAIEALRELGIECTVPIVSIAKRLEEIYYMDDPIPLHIDKKSPTLRLLQRIRDESHATAVAFHRKKRDQRTLKTQLTEIKGVGKVTAARLLAELKSVRRVQQATLAELTAIIGESRAQAVYDFLHPTITDTEIVESTTE
jgi:excinuclease ABC subunit C